MHVCERYYGESAVFAVVLPKEFCLLLREYARGALL